MTNILLIDDSEFDRQLVLRLLSRQAQWSATACRSGEEALERLRQQSFDLVITDLCMPGMDGLEVIEQIRTHYPAVPVILITSHGNEDVALQALQQGAASYIPKRALAGRLIESAETVLSAARHVQQCNEASRYLESQTTTLKLPNDRSLVPGVIAWMQDLAAAHGVVESQDAVRVGVALEEALLNAIIHGNLEVSSDLRSQDDGTLFEEFIQLHSTQEPFRSRHVIASLTLEPNSVHFQITDEGSGFDTDSIPDPTDPENLLRPSGRGLLLIQAFMDEVEFNDVGNSVRMSMHRRQPEPEAHDSGTLVEPARAC